MMLLLLFAIVIVICILAHPGRREMFDKAVLLGGEHVVSISRGMGAGQGGKPFFRTLPFAPRMSATVRFAIRFDPNFDYGCKGKIGGFQIGDEPSTGGQHSRNGSSFRLMWDSKGGAYMYIYVPLGSQPFQKYAALRAPPTSQGINMFEKGYAGALSPGSWHAVEMGVALNTFEWRVIRGRRILAPRPDGVITMRVGGKGHTLNGVVMRMSPRILLDRFVFNVFHGGPCVASKDMTLAIRDVQI